jgi:hypothetical protein
MSKVPDDVREELFQRICTEADDADWIHRSDANKAALYTRWAKSPSIGRALQDYMGPAEVHRYIKDTLIKNYVIQKMANPTLPLSILGLSDVNIKKSWIKPHGVILTDGRIIAWSAAQEWKTTIFAVFERSKTERGGQAYAVVLFNAEGKFSDGALQGIGNDAAQRFGIQRIIWSP